MSSASQARLGKRGLIEEHRETKKQCEHKLNKETAGQENKHKNKVQNRKLNTKTKHEP